MKNNLISRLSMLVAIVAFIVAFMASCTEKTSEYTNIIPADASAVVGIHIQSLMDKSGVSDADKQKLINVMKGELSAATFQQIEKIIKDGSASGLSMTDPIYLFVGSQFSSGGVVLKMDNIKKFNKALESILPEMSDGSITKENGYSTFGFDAITCAFNESALLLMDSGCDKEIISALMKQSKDKSITQNAYFENMSAKKGDITFFSTMNTLPNMYRQQINMTFGGINNVDPKDVAIIGTLNFEKGEIALQVETTSENEKVRALFEKQSELYGELNGTFPGNFPASTLAYVAFNVNGEKLYNMLLENKDFYENLPLDKVEKIKEVFAAFKGDISIGLLDVIMSGAPTFTMYAEATSGAAFNALFESKADYGFALWEDIVKLGKDQYVFKSNYMNIYFGYKDNYMYATNDDLNYKNVGTKENKSLKDAVYAPNMKGKHQYAVINMKAILDLPIVKLVAAMGDREADIYMDIASRVSYMEATGEGDNQMNITIRLVNEETNSLKQIIDLMKQYTGVQ